MDKVPSFRFRRIGLELRKIRKERGLTVSAAARLLDRSPASLSGIENGESIRTRDLEHILYKYDIDDAAFVEAMLELAREARKSGWWHRHAGTLDPAEMDFISLEADARTIRTYEIIAIPGLLQNESYARALIDAPDPQTLDRWVEIRMTRQQVMATPDPPLMSVILTEAALHQQIGGREVMRDQLTYLLEQSARGHVDLHVIPYAAGAHVGFSAPFTIVEVGRRGRLTVVVVETPERMLYIEQGDEVHRIAARFDRLRNSALSESDARAMIKQIMSEL
jgi:transcriptional regulator with XRE-family HTH domain